MDSPLFVIWIITDKVSYRYQHSHLYQIFHVEAAIMSVIYAIIYYASLNLLRLYAALCHIASCAFLRHSNKRSGDNMWLVIDHRYQ